MTQWSHGVMEPWSHGVMAKSNKLLQNSTAVDNPSDPQCCCHFLVKLRDVSDAVDSLSAAPLVNLKSFESLHYHVKDQIQAWYTAYIHTVLPKHNAALISKMRRYEG
jgi:hypothetical protein